jgi:hypothetical protein
VPARFFNEPAGKQEEYGDSPAPESFPQSSGSSYIQSAGYPSIGYSGNEHLIIKPTAGAVKHEPDHKRYYL